MLWRLIKYILGTWKLRWVKRKPSFLKEMMRIKKIRERKNKYKKNIFIINFDNFLSIFFGAALYRKNLLHLKILACETCNIFFVWVMIASYTVFLFLHHLFISNHVLLNLYDIMYLWPVFVPFLKLSYTFVQICILWYVIVTCNSPIV